MGQKVAVGMSGGVDSSVAAYILKKQGYDVVGVTLRLWQGGDSGCQADDVCYGSPVEEDARKVAEKLDIPHYVIDLKSEFKEHVIDYFVGEYLRGRTPNPCIACNRHVKWEALLRRSPEVGADYIATGHYARVVQLDNGRYSIAGSVSAAKDQTYALYRLTQEQLSRTLLPVGAYTKEEIRAMAKSAGLPVADKPDSQEICFVPDGDYAGFIENEVAVRNQMGNADEAGYKMPGPGNFVTADGRILGRHKGIIHYTVGQRRGLELPMGKRVFVTAIRPETNEVVVGENGDTFTDELLCDRVNFMAVADLEAPRHVLAKIRYNHPGEYCVIEKRPDGRVLCRFEKPVRAATSGQAVVFYEDGHVLGGGTIL